MFGICIIFTGSSGTFLATGLPTDRVPPLILEITASNQQGQQVAFLTRNVRLGNNCNPTCLYKSTRIMCDCSLLPLHTGLNGDCSVNFLNGVEEARVFQGLVFIEFASVGPVAFTDCQLDGGTFAPCESHAWKTCCASGTHTTQSTHRCSRGMFFSTLSACVYAFPLVYFKTKEFPQLAAVSQSSH